MRYNRNFNVAPAPSVMRTARLIAVAAIIGATAGAATVFSLLDRPAAEGSVAARTLAPDPRLPVTTNTSVAAQHTELQEVKSPAEAQNSAEQKAPPAPAAGAPARPQPSELTTSTPQRPTSAAALAEAPAVKESPSAQTFNSLVASTMLIPLSHSHGRVLDALGSSYQEAVEQLARACSDGAAACPFVRTHSSRKARKRLRHRQHYGV
jgi:hypothetical protein